MNSRCLLPILFLVATMLDAQETGPQITVSSGWTFATSDSAGTGAAWTTEESIFSGLSARWGSAFELSASVHSDFSGSALSADGLLEDLALTWTANAFTVVTVGKQRLSWGTARVFSSIDSLEPPLNPVDPKAKPRGITGLKAELIPLDWLSVWVLAIPAQRLDDAVLATRFDVLLEDADLSLGAVRSITNPITGFSGSDFIRDRRETVALFANFARFFDRFGLYGEAQVRQGRGREWFVAPGLQAAPYTLAALGSSRDWILKSTAGIQVEFPVWLNGTLRWLNEYHFNAEGFSEAEAQEFEQAWPLRGRPSPAVFVSPSGMWPGSFRQHYLYSGISGLPLAEKITASGSVLAGLDGGLLVLSSGISWDVGQSLGVSLGYEHYSCWNSSPGQSELLFLPTRNRVYLNVTAWY